MRGSVIGGSALVEEIVTGMLGRWRLRVFVMRNAMFGGVFNMIKTEYQEYHLYAMYHGILACWLRCVMELARC